MSVQTKIFTEPASGATLTSNITAGTASFVYTGTDAFAVGDIIAIEDEWIIVGAVNASTNTLSQCFRGKWSTAVAHGAGAVIRIVDPIATKTSPNSANQRILDRYGTAQEALDVMVAFIRFASRDSNRSNARNAAMADVTQAEHDADQDFDADWPT